MFGVVRPQANRFEEVLEEHRSPSPTPDRPQSQPTTAELPTSPTGPERTQSPASNLAKVPTIFPSTLAPTTEPVYSNPTFADSGFFTATNPNSQVELVSEKLKLRESTEIRAPVGESPTTQLGSSEAFQEQSTFLAASEDVSIDVPSSPADEVMLLRQKTPRKLPRKEPPPTIEDTIVVQPTPVRLRRASPTAKAPPSVRKIAATPVEPRRSGRLAQASPAPETVNNLPSPPSITGEVTLESTEPTGALWL